MTPPLPDLADLLALPPQDLADLAAEAVRALNHVTIETRPGHGGYRTPSDADATLANLQVLVERLPQALSQMARWLDGQGIDGRLRHDTYPAHQDRATSARQGRLTASAATDELGAARGMLTIAGADLARARDHSSHLGAFGDDPHTGADLDDVDDAQRGPL